MPGKAQYNSNFHNAHARRQRGGHSAPAVQNPADNVVRFHGPGACVQPHALAAGPLPLALSAVVLHTDLECLPIEVAASVLWPYMNEIPQACPIRNFTEFYNALAEWNELESQAVQDAHELVRVQAPETRVIWATRLGRQAQFADYRFAGLVAHSSNRFWARRWGLECNPQGAGGPQFVLQLESLRVAMELIMLRLFPVSLARHIALLKALDSIEEGKGFADPQGAQRDATDLGLEGINFTHPKYSPVARNSIRMKILASAAQVVAQRYPMQEAAR